MKKLSKDIAGISQLIRAEKYSEAQKKIQQIELKEDDPSGLHQTETGRRQQLQHQIDFRFFRDVALPSFWPYGGGN